MTAFEIINRYIAFFEKRRHKRIPNAALVPENDPTTLFTSSGMQPLVPYLLGEQHPMGRRLVNVQNSFRAQDIDEVGDNRHTTFFRMLGNWSLGDYFKQEQLPWFFEFLTSKTEGLGLDPQKLYVTAFKGNDQIPQDMDSIKIWQKLFQEKGIDAKLNERIFLYDVDKNWWSRSGTPDKMPVGEIGGTDSEAFYEFADVKHDKKFGEKCHPNCDCGRFMEIGNSVFMQYKKTEKGFEELPNKNVDFGGGLERLTTTTNNNPDIFATDLYINIIKTIEEYSGGNYSKSEDQKSIRIIADHLKAATYMIASDIIPSNKERGYILRRLMRRAAVKMHQLKGGLTPIPGFEAICEEVLIVEENISQGVLSRARDRVKIFQIVKEEMEKFAASLDKGLRILEDYNNLQLNESNAFNLYQTYGFPFEVSEELFRQRGKKLDRERFNKIMETHRDLSRKASSGMFKGGLADHSEKTVMGHTATHLLHKALRDLFGEQLHQTGSNITSERVRFDFNFERNLTPEELKKIEDSVNEKIKEDLPVHFEIMPLKKAKDIGAIGLFDEKYSDNVKVYFIGPSSQNSSGHSTLRDEPSGHRLRGHRSGSRSSDSKRRPFSVEFCGGPHVDFTSKIKRFTIFKQENIGKGIRRIYAKVE